MGSGHGRSTRACGEVSGWSERFLVGAVNQGHVPPYLENSEVETLDVSYST